MDASRFKTIALAMAETEDTLTIDAERRAFNDAVASTAAALTIDAERLRTMGPSSPRGAEASDENPSISYSGLVFYNSSGKQRIHLVSIKADQIPDELQVVTCSLPVCRAVDDCLLHPSGVCHVEVHDLRPVGLA
jgi:hypothetical protein